MQISFIADIMSYYHGQGRVIKTFNWPMEGSFEVNFTVGQQFQMTSERFGNTDAERLSDISEFLRRLPDD